MTQRKWTFGAAVFLIMSATLMLQIILTRMLSVIAWYYLAFFVIGIAMFGLSAGGVWVYLRKERFTPDNLIEHLSFYCVLFAGSVFVSIFVLTGLMPLLGFFDPAGGAKVWIIKAALWTLGTIGIGLPFVISGIIASLALTRSKYSTAYVYACDLIGAASGCLIVLAVLTWVDGVSALLITALIGFLSASIFQASGTSHLPRDLTGWQSTVLRRRAGFAVFTLILAMGNIVTDGAVRPWASKGLAEIGRNTPDFIGWNSFSRITATPKRVAPAWLWGASPQYKREDWIIEQRTHKIDGDAETFVYHLPEGLESAGFLDFDVSNLAYQRAGIDTSAVIGIGAGRDLLSAKYYGVAKVTGIEINDILVDLLFADNEFAEFAGIDRLKGITVVNDEARNWFARTDASFDLIQMSLIDTWAATGAGAFTLSENALYTVEGWTTFMNRLNEGGTFTVSRWFNAQSVHEMGRILSLAMAVGFELGFEDPSQHIFVATSARIATLILSKEPLHADALERYSAWVAFREFEVLVSPDKPRTGDVIGRIMSAGDRSALERAVEASKFDLSPPTDNRPFFFNQLPFSTALDLILGNGGSMGVGVIGGNLIATKTLLMLFSLSLVFVVSCLLWPMRQGLRESEVAVVAGGSTYFGLIGLGFMFAEIGMMQRYSVFLGHPTYALGIVLFSLILATGCGSALSSRIALNSIRRMVAWIFLTSGYLVLLALFSGDFLNEFQAAEFAARCLITIGTILPAGLLMGFAFPNGMNMVNARDNRPTPWFWGLNGAAGVLASVLALIVAMTFGIDTVLVLAAACYLLLVPSIMILKSRPA